LIFLEVLLNNKDMKALILSTILTLIKKLKNFSKNPKVFSQASDIYYRAVKATNR